MKLVPAVLAGAALLFAGAAVRAQNDPSAKFQEARAMLRDGRTALLAVEKARLDARRQFESAAGLLMEVKALNPDWNAGEVAQASAECGEALAGLAAGPAPAAEPPAVRGAGAPARLTPAASAGAFIGHKERKKVHRAECKWAQKIAEKNRAYFDTYQAAAAAGYSPCKSCKADEAASSGAAPVPARVAWVEKPGEPPFVGDTGSKVVHRAECARAQEVPARKRMFFMRCAEAMAVGAIPCALCRPEDVPAAAVSPSGGAVVSPGSRPFIGHSASKKVHRAECKWAQKIAERNRVYFTNCQEAVAAGYSPCRTCKPDEPSSPSPGDSGGPAPAPDAAQAGTEAQTPAAGELCASSTGKTFHRPDCAWGKKISGKNLVIYKTRDEALASGKTPCRVCKP
jgi:methylphosphotriester-DNA--protein-cysteine methyltransferase